LEDLQSSNICIINIYYHMSRSLTALAVCIMLVLPVAPVLGGSQWKEGSTAFKTGTRTNTNVVTDHLQLGNITPSGTWKKVNDGQPGGLADGAYAANLEGRVVLFGGGENCVNPSLGSNPLTWVYDTINNSWHQLEPAVSPQARAEASMVYNSKVGKFVLFGGKSGSFYFNDTWTFELKTETWTNVTFGAHPRARSESAMVYDKGHDTILLYGGSWGTKNDDLWEYNITTNIWSTRKIGAAPGPQQNISMVYVDSINADVMNDEQSSIWIYRYATNDWVKTSGSFSYPWRDGTLVYNSDRDEVVMQRLTTWIYHPLTDKWDEFNPQPTPDMRQGYGMVYDVKTKKVLLHGGTYWDGGPLMDPIFPMPELWRFDPPLRTWALQPVAPLNTYGTRMTWDQDTNTPILYGGWWASIPWINQVDADNGVYLYHANDTFEQLKDLTGKAMRTPDYHAMAYDPVSKKLFVVGGFYNTTFITPPCYGPTWAYDTVNKNWTQSKQVPQPSCRGYHSMAYDEAAKKMVLFGGEEVLSGPLRYLNDTWTLDPATGIWQNVTPAGSPAKRNFAAMTYVRSTKEIMLFGGGSIKPAQNFNDLWAYNITSNKWRFVASDGPSPLEAAGMAYDPGRDVVVVYGGMNATTGYSKELWLFDIKNSTWVNITTNAGPGGRANPEMIYDPVRDGFLVYGGDESGTMKCDTWLYKFDAVDRNGTYASQPLDMNGTAYFGSISWNSTIPADTSLKFQVRTGKDLSDLNLKVYIGPDGTTTTFYTVNNTRLNGVHNGSRFIQYKAYFHSMDWRNSPKLFNVKITYNLMHSVLVTRPKTGDVLKGNANITWTGSDKDGDNLYYKVIVEEKSGKNWTIRDGTATTSVDPWDTLAYPNGSYRIRVIASDNNNMIPLSASNVTGWFDIKNPPNGPPFVNLKSPLDGSIISAEITTLRWTGDDPDKDPMTSYLFIGKDRNNLMNEKPVHLVDTKYDLVGNGTYYWTVIPNDGKVNGSCLSGIWKVVLEKQNFMPRAWLESPKNAEIVNSNMVVLKWNGSDYDKDPLTYFVYLSNELPIEIGCNSKAMILHTNKTTYTVNLNEGTYYWTVIPSDGKTNGLSDSGVWSFWVSIPSLYVTIGITNPGNHSVVSGMVNITGWANPAVGVSLVVVKVRIDGGQWTNAVGKKNWNFLLNTKQLADGPHKIEAQAFGDQFRESKVVYIEVIVRNAIKQTRVESSLCLWFVLVAVAVSVGIAIGKYYYDNRKRPRSGYTSSTTNIK
jgi:hypothetical protein